MCMVGALSGWHEDAAALITKLSRQLASTEGEEQIKHLFKMQMLGILCAAILIQYSTEHPCINMQRLMVTRTVMPLKIKTGFTCFFTYECDITYLLFQIKVESR